MTSANEESFIYKHGGIINFKQASLALVRAHFPS
jgi:hypothetical protein